MANFCFHCGRRLAGTEKFCPGCGSSLQSAPQAVAPVNRFGYQAPPPKLYSQPGMRYGESYYRCQRCGGQMQMQTVTEYKKVTFGTVLLYILLCITILGILIVIPLVLRNKTYTVTYKVCQSCGNRVRVG